MNHHRILTSIALSTLLTLSYGCSSDDTPDQPDALLARYDSLMAQQTDDDSPVETASESSGGFDAGTYSYNGTINGSLPIEMNLDVAGDGSVIGEYWYTKNRIPIEIRGTVQDRTISLEEYSEGARTGIFSGSYQTPSLLTGTWASPDGRKAFPFTLSATVDNTPIAMDSPSPSSSTPTTTASTGGVYTIDQYLNDYEDYMLRLMKSMKKMESNDPSAMQEYFDALQKAQSMSQKLNGMQGEMEPRHLKRLMELNQKLATAAQKM